MKKFICILMSLLIMGAASFAQNKEAKKSVKKTTTTTTTTKEPQAKPAPGTKLKKDGTPDMRYKENKAAAKPAAGPMKKDGTPDMRHKANKKDAPAKK